MQVSDAHIEFGIGCPLCRGCPSSILLGSRGLGHKRSGNTVAPYWAASR